MTDESPVSSAVVSGYIRAAYKDARSFAERIALLEARMLVESDGPLPGASATIIRTPDIDHTYPPKDERPNKDRDEALKQVATWQELIMEQLHLALCTRSAKYAKEVATIKDNANVLIGAIAVAVAGTIGVAVAVIAAMVAAFLHLVFKMGIAAFCEASKQKGFSLKQARK